MYVATIDQGTTGSRVAMFDHNGTSIAYAYKEHGQFYPKPGWVEQDPTEIWENVCLLIRQVLERSKIDPREILTLGVTNQRETTIAWERKTGKPIHNAIVWQCRRTAPLIDGLKKEGLQETIHRKTGLIPDAYFSGTKIQWMMENVPAARRKAKNGEILFGTVDSWIIWKLTGAHVTDYSNASRTMLFNIQRLDWDDELLEMMGGIPREALPLPKPSVNKEIYGYTDKKIFGSAEVPVTADLGDQQAALFGQVGFNLGEIKTTYGTGNFILMNTGEKPLFSEHGLLTTIAYGIDNSPPVYALEGSIFITGAAVQWLRDNLKIIESARDTEEIAGEVEDTDDVYVVPAFVGLGAPHWDMYARGLIVGLTRGTTRAHLVRATLESECYQTRDVLEVMKAESHVPIKTMRVDGGGANNDLMMQFQADILGIPVIRPKVTETTSLGAAYAAGLAVGFWKDLSELTERWRIGRVFKPEMEESTRDRLCGRWKKAVRLALGWGKDGETEA
ncbi:MAG: glycerol kinase GlpK [Candidatus Bathyarchaeota archaeon]|nr:glycerol kinase GlpK [Candidatus Bathyarchaeota archaeon]